MSPVPLIELQRRLAEAGRIRLGDRTDKGAPRRLTTWRITSPTRRLIDQAAELYGGTVKPWTSPTGEQWEVVTATSDLPVLVMPGYSLTQTYERWLGPSKCDRRCDGNEMTDGSPCACNTTGEDVCELHTRLTVALPELTTMLGWRLESKGQSAARELLASMEIVQAMAAGRPFIPARLRVVERRGQRDGQALRFVVPVIDVEVAYQQLVGARVEAPALVAAAPALPTGYQPLTSIDPGVTLADALEQVERQQPRRTSRSAEPIQQFGEFEFGTDPVPVPTETVGGPGEPTVATAEATAARPEQGGDRAASPTGTPSVGDPQPPSSPPVTAAAPTDRSKPTQAQTRKLNTLVGQLREHGLVNTEQLWVALAKSRRLPVDDLVQLLEGRDENGQLHWSPLRNSLSRDEASNLINRLEDYERKVVA